MLQALERVAHALHLTALDEVGDLQDEKEDLERLEAHHARRLEALDESRTRLHGRLQLARVPLQQVYEALAQYEHDVRVADSIERAELDAERHVVGGRRVVLLAKQNVLQNK